MRLKVNTKACGNNKSCESTNPQISIRIKWPALRQLAIETGENWRSNRTFQSMGKLDFIGLSLSNPQSGQSLFLLQDSNSPYLSLSLSPSIYTGCIASLSNKNISRGRQIFEKIFEDGFEGKLLRFFSYKMSPTGDISHKISIFVKNVSHVCLVLVFFHGLNFELFDNFSVDITEIPCIYRKRNCAVTPFSFRKSRRIERDIEKVGVNSPKIDR